MSTQWVDNSTDLLFNKKDSRRYDRGSIEFLFKLANDNYKNHKYRMVVVYLKKILQIVPEEINAYKLLAKTYCQTKLFKRAANVLRQAIELSYNDPELHYLLAKIYLLQGNHQHFLRELTKTLVVNENYAPAYNALGMYYFSIKDYIKALENVEKAINLTSNDLSSRILRGKIFLQEKLYNQALEDFDFVLTYNTDNKEIHKLIAQCYYYLGDYQQALEEFAQAQCYNELFFKAFENEKEFLEKQIANDPLDINKKMDLASLYFTAVKYPEAAQILNQVIEAHPAYLPAKINLGLLLVFDNKYYEAIKLYQEVLTISPANKQAQQNLEKAYTLSEQYYKARVNSPEDILKLSNIYLQQGLIDKAMLCQHEFRKRYGQDKKVLEILENTARSALSSATKYQLDQYLIYQAACLFILNEITQAEYILNNLAADKYVGREYFLGLIYKKNGQVKKAFDYFEKARKLDETYWLAESELHAIINFELNRLEKQLKLNPQDEKLNEEYLQILILRNSFKQALAHLVKLKKSGITTPLLDNKMSEIIDSYEAELELKMESTDIDAQTYLDLCEIYLHKKRYFEAFTLIQEASKKHHKDQQINNYYQFVLNKAIEVYEKIILEDKVEANIYYNLAILYAKKNYKEKSLKVLALACTDNKKLALNARYEEAFQDYYNSEAFRKAVVIDRESEQHINQWLD